MKSFPLLTVFTLTLFSFVLVTPLPAQATEDDQLEQSATETDQEAAKPQGSKKVTEKLKSRFNVTDERINQLRNQKMGYGEIKNALSLAEQLPGGITDENVAKVMSLRNGEKKKGWGAVAKELNLKLGDVLKKSKDTDKKLKEAQEKVEKNTASAEKKMKAEKDQIKTRVEKTNKAMEHAPKAPSMKVNSPKTHRGKK